MRSRSGGRISALNFLHVPGDPQLEKLVSPLQFRLLGEKLSQLSDHRLATRKDLRVANITLNLGGVYFDSYFDELYFLYLDVARADARERSLYVIAVGCAFPFLS